MKVRVLCAAAFIAAACAPAAQAQLTDSAKLRLPVYRLRELVVSATIPYATNGGASALEVRPDSMRLPPAPTLERVLRELPFLQVRTNARGDGYFALRGSSFDAREVAVLVDGLPVSLGFDHRADLSVLPTTGAQTITVIRGIPSLLYGPNVLGGIVEIGMTRGSGEVRSQRVSAGYDHAGGYALDAAASIGQAMKAGHAQLRAGGGYRGTDGFPLPKGVQEPAPFSEEEVRLNSDRIQRDAFASARYDGNGGGWFSLSGFGYSAERGTPAELNTTTARFWRYPSLQRWMGIASAGTADRASLLGGRMRAQASVAYDAGRTELIGYTNRTYSTVQDRELDDDRNVTGRAVATHSITAAGDVSAALTFTDVRRDETLTPGVTSEYQQRLWSGALETGWQLARVRLSAGVAYDASDTPASADKPVVGRNDTWGARVGLAGAFADGNLLLHAGVARRARFPSLRELYAGALRMFEPNPDLRHEVLIASEAGGTVQLGVTQMQAVLFHHRIEDQIVRSVTPTRRVKRINRDQTNSTGLELLASVRLRGVTAAADVTAQTVSSRDPEADHEFRAEYQPKWAGGARLTADAPLGMRLHVGTRFTGVQYCLTNSGAYNRLEQTTRADVELSRSWRSLEIGLAADNVSDTAIYDQCGLPQPGRVIRLRVRWH